MLDRLVRRAVLAEADRVVRPDPERLHVAERGEPDGRAHVVREDQEGRAVRLQHPLRERDPVHDRAHRVLADPERDVAARVGRREHAGALELRLRRLDEVGRAADHRRRERLDRLHHLLAGVARGHPLARPGTPAAPRSSPAAACRSGPPPTPRAASGTSRPRARSGRATPARPRSRRASCPCARRPRPATSKCLSGSSPSASFAARTSSSPSGAPWDFDVSIACGAP